MQSVECEQSFNLFRHIAQAYAQEHLVTSKLCEKVERVAKQPCNFPTRYFEHHTKQLLCSDDNHKPIQTVVRNEFERVAKQPFSLIYYMVNVFVQKILTKP